VERALSITANVQPYSGREEAIETFAAHVNRGKAGALQTLGVDIVIGEREGARFRDAYSGQWYWNCHYPLPPFEAEDGLGPHLRARRVVDSEPSRPDLSSCSHAEAVRDRSIPTRRGRPALLRSEG
jgi:hypothetical protein